MGNSVSPGYDVAVFKILALRDMMEWVGGTIELQGQGIDRARVSG